MAQRLGNSVAQQLGNYHESFRESLSRGQGEWTANSKVDQRIDLKNNWEGIKCAGKSKQGCIDCCLETRWWGWTGKRGAIRKITENDPPGATTPGDSAPQSSTPSSGGKNEKDDGTGGSGVPQGGKPDKEKEKPDREPEEPRGVPPGP